MTHLATTARCADDDLAHPTLHAVAELLIKKFYELRGQAPAAGEPISGLRERDCRSLHGSRYRGVTWYDLEHDTVWLVAAYIHREDSRDDSYAVAIDLERAGQLYPTEEDYSSLAADRARNAQAARIEVEIEALQQLRDQVLSTPNAPPRRYTSQDDLYVEMWADADPELALLVLRFRIFRRAAQGLTPTEITAFLTAVFASDPYDEVGDDDGRFRRFESLIAR